MRISDWSSDVCSSDLNRQCGAQKHFDDGSRLDVGDLRRARQIKQDAKPCEQADDQKDLPDAAEVEIFPSLVANPEPTVAEHLKNDSPFDEPAAADHHGQRDEQQMGAEIGRTSR